MALHDDEFAAWIAAPTELQLTLEVACVPNGFVLGKNLRVLERTSTPMDMIVEQITLALGDTEHSTITCS